MKILGIETSCDETALSIIEASGDLDNPQITILKEIVNSQIETHKKYGGVFPAEAKKRHQENLPILLEKIDLRKDNKPDIDFIAVTYGPGLEPCLWTGITFAQELSKAWNIPLLPINHMEGHIASVLLSRDPSKRQDKNAVAFPFLALLISGAHTELVYATEWGKYKILGKTLDDAVGEAYDKVGRMLDIPYPGGPELSRLAQKAREEHLQDDEITLPRMMLNKSLDFSFSGLKTAVLYKIQKLEKISDIQKKIIAKEFEDSVVDLLIRKTRKALEKNEVKTFIASGGVIANTYIRENLTKLCDEFEVKVLFPPQELSGDNAVMIAIAGYLKQFREKPSMNVEIIAKGNLTLDQ